MLKGRGIGAGGGNRLKFVDVKPQIDGQGLFMVQGIQAHAGQHSSNQAIFHTLFWADFSFFGEFLSPRFTEAFKPRGIALISLLSLSFNVNSSESDY